MNRTQKNILIGLVSVVVLTLTTAIIIRARKKGGKKYKSLRKKGTMVCSHIGKFDGAGEVQAKMVNPMKAGVIMTNHPLKLQRYLKSVQ